MLLGKGEELSGGREKPSILADAMEAIIGAVYIASGMDGARDFVLRTFEQRLATAQADGADHKSRLQELTAHRFGLAPHYDVETSGPDHARSFTVTVTVDGTAHGTGVGRSKKQAEQQAARHAVAALTEPVVPIDIEAEVDDESSTEPAPLGEAEAEPSDTRAAGDDAGDDLEEIHHG
jgi:ribonuclease-3